MSDHSYLDPYVNDFLTGDTRTRNIAIGRLMTIYQHIVVEYVEETHGKDVAYSLAKAIWWEYQHRTEGCDCTSENRW